MIASRERAFAALEWRESDGVALEYSSNKDRAMFEHGQKIIDLWERYPDDFGQCENSVLPCPNPTNYEADGTYHEYNTDKWGTTWEIHAFGECGHPCKVPIETEEQILAYSFPPVDYGREEDFLKYKQEITNQKKKYFRRDGWVSFFEKLIALRRYEDVLMDIAMDTDEINLLADRLVDYQSANIKKYIEAGTDAVLFGDDYGTQNSLIMSPESWRRFVKPRLKRMIAPIKEAGVKVMLHSCGQISEILEDLKEVGVDSVWPQLGLYNDVELADKCRDIQLALALHLDRVHLMNLGGSAEIRAAVDRAVSVFQPQKGGSWFYVEVDTGFSFENITALIEAISAYRR